MIKISDLIPYALAGRASFTIKGKDGVYHFKISKKRGPVWYVYSSYNGDDWSYLGHIDKDQELIFGQKSEVNIGEKISVCIIFVWKKALIQEDIPFIEIWHDGKCARCGRELTDEISVKRGLGPTCYLKED